MPESLDNLLKELNSAVEGFNSSLNVIQADVLAEVELLLKDIEVSNGNIVRDVANLKRINKVKDRIEKVVISPEYKQRVIDFGRSFDTITKIQSEYFTALVEDYSVPEILYEIKKIAVEDTVASLTEAGIRANITDKIGSLIQDSIESGAKYTDLTKQLKAFIIGDETGGAMEKYAGTITTDAINTYSATYNKIVTDDLGLVWSVYVGALVGGSRDICEELVHKKYIHKSELPEIVKGHVNGKHLPLYPKTGLPYGMIAGTNANNFQVRRGGHNCNHLLMPTVAERVPVDIRSKFDKTLKAVA